jgi:hypothetical protein
MCRIKHLKPNYITIKINGKKSQDKKTTTNAIKYRINQEIKFLHCEKQNLNQQLYHIHLKCAHYCKGMRQHIQNSINSRLKDIMDTLYQKLIKKLDTPTKHTQVTHNTEKNTHTFHSRLVNLTNIKFTKEQINTLTLGFNYAIEKDPKYRINELIIGTQNAIRHLDSKIQNTFRHLATKKVKQIITINILSTLQKRRQHNLNQIKKILQRNNQTITKADKLKLWS